MILVNDNNRQKFIEFNKSHPKGHFTITRMGEIKISMEK